jgi:hypothetical protein
LGNSSKREPRFRCCEGGKIQLPPIKDTPRELRDLLSQTEVNAQGERVFTLRSREFLQRIRAYNNAVSFTSLGAKIDHTITNNAHNVYSLRVQGEVYHRAGALLPEPGERPQYAQVSMTTLRC